MIQIFSQNYDASTHNIIDWLYHKNQAVQRLNGKDWYKNFELSFEISKSGIELKIDKSQVFWGRRWALFETVGPKVTVAENEKERQARRIIDEMKSMGLPIAYCKKEKHYFYKSEVQMKFEIEVVKGDKLKKIIGGTKKDFDFLNLFFTRTFFDRDTAQLCSRLANNGLSHLAGGADA
jgi:hypothetical protein